MKDIGDIAIRSRKWAKEFESAQPWAAISVSTEVGDFPELHTENRLGLLRLCFWDIANPTFKQEEYLKDKLFSKEQAEQILEFASDMWDRAETLLIHCEAGLSRSPAIGAALSRIYFGQGAAQPFFQRYMPNHYVYKTLLEVHFGADSRVMVEAKKNLSEKVYEEPWDCTE